jgi:hypothetical protein
MKRFFRRLHAIWLKRRFAALDREIKWNRDRFEEVMEQLRASRLRVSRNLHRISQAEDAPPELVVSVGNARIRTNR